MIHPYLRPTTRSHPRTQGWRVAASMSLAATILAGTAGSTLSSWVGSRGLGWEWADVVLAPLTALVGAASVYTSYRHLPLDSIRVRVSRTVVVGAGGAMVVALVTGHQGMAGAALWLMAAATVVVTTLAAAGQAPDESQRPVPWARSA